MPMVKPSIFKVLRCGARGLRTAHERCAILVQTASRVQHPAILMG